MLFLTSGLNLACFLPDLYRLYTVLVLCNVQLP